MRATEKIYKAARNYREKLAELQNERDRAIEAAEDMRGSTAYEKAVYSAKSKLQAARADLQTETREEIRQAAASMQQAIDGYMRAAAVPTSEQLRVLEVLRMRENIKPDEIEAAAYQLRGCPLALSVLEEIAVKHELRQLVPLMDTGLSRDAVFDAASNLTKAAYNVACMPEAGYGEKYLLPGDQYNNPYEDGNREHHWGAWDNDGNFTSESKFLSRCLMSWDDSKIREFSAIVNGETETKEQ